MAADHKHLVLSIELPSFYTEDINIEAERRDYFQGSGISDSEILLGHVGDPGLVKLTMEVSGEKYSEVIETLGMVRTASLMTPTPGLTDEDLDEQAWKLRPDQDEVIEMAVRRLRREDVPLSEIIELLEGEIADVRRWMAREAAK